MAPCRILGSGDRRRADLEGAEIGLDTGGRHPFSNHRCKELSG